MVQSRRPRAAKRKLVAKAKVVPRTTTAVAPNKKVAATKRRVGPKKKIATTNQKVASTKKKVAATNQKVAATPKMRARRPTEQRPPRPARPTTRRRPARPATNRRPERLTVIAAPIHVPSPAPPPVPPWREALRAELATTGDHFAAYLRGLRASGWEHADTPELAGLERWGSELTARDRHAGIGALVRVAQHGIVHAIAAGGIGLEGMGFVASEPVPEGAPVERQVALAAAWLDAPDAAHLAAVAAGTDRSRRTPIWDDDLRPSDDRAHWWYLDVGQCCCHAILRTSGDSSRPSYDAWDAATCVGRGLVAAVRGLRHKGADLGALLADIRRAMVAPR